MHLRGRLAQFVLDAAGDALSLQEFLAVVLQARLRLLQVPEEETAQEVGLVGLLLHLLLLLVVLSEGLGLGPTLVPNSSNGGGF